MTCGVHLYEELHDAKGLIKIRKIEGGYTTQWTKEKGQTTIYNVQSNTHKTKDRVT